MEPISTRHGVDVSCSERPQAAMSDPRPLLRPLGREAVANLGQESPQSLGWESFRRASHHVFMRSRISATCWAGLIASQRVNLLNVSPYALGLGASLRRNGPAIPAIHPFFAAQCGGRVRNLKR